MENVREIVLDTLLALEKGESLSHQLIRNVLDKYDYLDVREKSFIKRVTEGTIERRMELDYYLDAFSSIPVKKMKPLVRCLLRMSAYQILFMDAIPNSAVCNEACKLASKRKFQNLKGFVNAILRKVAREKNNLPMPDPQKEALAYLCVRYSLPEWIVKMWCGEYGREIMEEMGRALLEIHPVSLRVTDNALTDPDNELGLIEERLKQADIQVQRSEYLPDIFLTFEAEGLRGLPDFQEGNLAVQDISSVLAVKAAGIREGDFVVDICGSPGGKAILASELVGKTGRVITGDVSEGKVEKISENIARMKRENVEVRVWDGRILEESLLGKADVLILDVPCSGLGVIGKKRDIKYRLSEQSLTELSALQKEIVGNAWQYVKPGGILLYSTCTVRREENRDMVEWIVQSFPFEPVSLQGRVPEMVMEGIKREREARKNATLSTQMEECMAQLLPGILNADGFFFAVLRRKEDAGRE